MEDSDVFSTWRLHLTSLSLTLTAVDNIVIIVLTINYTNNLLFHSFCVLFCKPFVVLSFLPWQASPVVLLELLYIILFLKKIIVQELCESRGGRPGLSVLTSLLVSVDVKLYWTMLRHWSQLVPNMSTDIHYRPTFWNIQSRARIHDNNQLRTGGVTALAER